MTDNAELHQASSIPNSRVTDDLHRITGVLRDMADAEEFDVTPTPASPGVPPAVFGAGGPL